MHSSTYIPAIDESSKESLLLSVEFLCSTSNRDTLLYMWIYLLLFIISGMINLKYIDFAKKYCVWRRLEIFLFFFLPNLDSASAFIKNKIKELQINNPKLSKIKINQINIT